MSNNNKLNNDIHILFSTGSGVWLNEKKEDIPYIPADDRDGDGDATHTSPALEGFTRFWTFIIIYQVENIVMS